MSLGQTIKKIAGAANNAATPAAFLYADVIQASPLRVFVDNRFELDEAFLVIPEHMRRKEISLIHSHSIGAGGSGPTPPPSVTTETASGHSHEIKGQTTGSALFVLVIHRGIEMGDRLILFRNQGGEEYLVIGKVKENGDATT